MDSNFAIKAQDQLKQAHQKMKGGFLKNIFGSKEERIEEACELFKQAGVNFKLAKRWEDAAQAYLQCANCEKTIKGADFGEYLVEAANCYEKISNSDAIQQYEKAIEFYCNDSRISYAAKYKKKIAQIYESDFEYTLASKAYLDAADLFNAEANYSSEYCQCLQKGAELIAYQAVPNYGEAIKYLDIVSEKQLENRLTAPSARKLFFNACLLYLCNNDSIGCVNALEKYQNKDPTFTNQRECKFVKGLVQAIEEKNLTKFSDECYNFNQIMPLDTWNTKMLARIKEQLESSIKGDNWL